MSNYPAGADKDPNAPWNQPDREDEWRWFFAEKCIINIYAQSEEEVMEIIAKMEALGTPRFTNGQTKPCIEIECGKWESDE